MRSSVKITLINFAYLLGSLLSNESIRILATIFFFLCILFEENCESLEILIGLSANQAIVVFREGGISLIGFGYLIMAGKILIARNPKLELKILIPFYTLIFTGIALFITVKSYHDFALSVELFLAIYVIMFTFNAYKKNEIYKFISSYMFGCILCIFNMLIEAVIFGYSGERANGVMDNANYIAISFSFAAVCCFILYLHKIETKTSIILFYSFILVLLSTGSRGALLSLIISLIWMFIFEFDKLLQKKTLIFTLVLSAFFIYILYVKRIDFIVNIYNNLVQRTIEKLGVAIASKYMDISSGRITLWKYYYGMFSSQNLFSKLIGNGSDRYYLINNGGFGALSHNFLIGSLMSVGIIGTTSLIFMYLNFYDSIVESKCALKNRAKDFPLWITFVCGYSFLDGIFDSRIVIYISISIAIKILIENNPSNFIMK